MERLRLCITVQTRILLFFNLHLGGIGFQSRKTMRTDGKKADSQAVRKLVLQPISNKKAGTAKAVPTILVGVAGFEPAASWTRTMRDTKLRHTPIALIL